MLMALLKGKLSREQENMEDILTSNVFGLLKYLPPEEGLLPYLAQAETLDEQRPFADLAIPGTKVKYEFWPWHSEAGCVGCEPDVELTITWPSGKKALVFVEAKYLSGKSSEEDDESTEDKKPAQPEPPKDQLAKEWQNLVSRAGENIEPVLVYLTADVAMPCQDLKDSRTAFKAKCRGATRPFNCAWLSWRHLHSVATGSRHEAMVDMNRMLQRLNLLFFSGIPEFRRLAPFDWSFAAPRHETPRRSRQAEVVAHLNFEFSFPSVGPIQWRFKP